MGSSTKPGHTSFMYLYEIPLMKAMKSEFLAYLTIYTNYKENHNNIQSSMT